MDAYFSDFDSDSEYDDELVYGGQASCILSNLEQTIGKIDDFLAFEREYVHGDVVCSIGDPTGQMGKVINVEKVVDLENVHGKKMKNVISRKLKRVCSISIGDYVVTGHWLGKAERVVDRVSVMFDDGAKGEFTAMDDEMLKPVSSDSFHDSQFAYWPGQRVKVKRSFSWFCGTEHKQNEGTVCAVNVGFVYVKWLGCSLSGSERTMVPDPFQRSDHLTTLTCFTHSNWQLGDCCLVPGFQDIFVVTKTKSKVNVLWQDGSESHGLDSGCVGPVNIVDPHDFWPHQFVLEKGTSDDQQNKRWGVVKTVDAIEKTVKVKWEGNDIEETVSAYELIEHPEFSYCYGDVVFGLEKSCPIGIVIGFKDGRVEVKWVHGFTSEVGPNEIFRMDKSDGVMGIRMLHQENVEPIQEKAEHDVHLIDPNVKDLLDVYSDKKDCFNVPQAAISKNLENFEMVNDCSMHHFVDHAGKGSISNQVKRNWLKKVQQEWNILMKDLPETIYVRVFVERMDLLQVAIVGAPGTPYHDGLFFFDIFLPPEYPHEPPMVHYKSGGLRVNPNLYDYNENVFLMNCKTILFTLRNPPQHFEALVEEHFRKRCTYILMACKAYMEGVPIGYAFGDEHIDPKGQTKVSTGFKITLSKLFSKLVQTFSENGFDCGEYSSLIDGL
ncbi:hypothetical protein L1987_03414 [Smallanthus sonchifolius]|uniref:Uncharacterized protein n=1 Tax=Smallanthus sonchifolius TaxID=185202 RepID=A0ACB9KAM6_9ASTR|nr:hypothetical protein L1987_03414 [Smallanthus sonchifolius]